jgi:hypothetical protein
VRSPWPDPSPGVNRPPACAVPSTPSQCSMTGPQTPPDKRQADVAIKRLDRR